MTDTSRRSPFAAFAGGALCLGATLSGCAPDARPQQQQGVPALGVGIANPASVYCVQQGGKLELRKETGGEVGYCHLPDGRVIEEWALFRASHAQQQ